MAFHRNLTWCWSEGPCKFVVGDLSTILWTTRWLADLSVCRTGVISTEGEKINELKCWLFADHTNGRVNCDLRAFFKSPRNIHNNQLLFWVILLCCRSLGNQFSIESILINSYLDGLLFMLLPLLPSLHYNYEKSGEGLARIVGVNSKVAWRVCGAVEWLGHEKNHARSGWPARIGRLWELIM